jgi:serine/threonine protein kinase
MDEQHANSSTETGPGAVEPPWLQEFAPRVLKTLETLEEEFTEATGGVQDKLDFELPVVEGYVFEEEIGRGSGGIVFSGYKLDTEQRVAIKVLYRRSGFDKESQRVWRELEAGARFAHAPVPRLHGHHSFLGGICLIFDFIDGLDICTYANDHNLSLEERVELLIEACRVVQQVHSKAILHRDLKPQHILVDEQGKVWIIDLGLAAILDDDPTQTITAEGRPIGTLHFMSPEQAQGQRERISTQSDVYGLGAVGYMLLAGEPPHAATSTGPESWYRIANDTARDPRSIQPRMSKALASILQKACARDPEARYASAEALAMDLENWLQRRPVTARPPTRWQRMAVWIAQHPILTTVAACSTIVVGTFISVLILSRFMLQNPVDTLSWNKAVGTVELRSRADIMIRRWDFGRKSCAGAEIMDGPAGKPLIVVGGIRQADTLPGMFQVLSFNSNPEVLWDSLRTTPTVPRDIYNQAMTITGEPTMLRWVGVADVFAELPGDEIIAVFHHPAYSPACIRIYDGLGATLFEIWHDGWILGYDWIEDHDCLVFCGVNSEARLEELGETNTSIHVHPVIVFAIRPRLGGVSKQWIDPVDPPSPLVPWYARIVPHAAINWAAPSALEMEVTDRFVAVPDNAMVVVDLVDADGKEAAIMLVIDERGHVIQVRQDDVHASNHEPWSNEGLPRFELDHEQFRRALAGYRGRSTQGDSKK